MCKGWISYPVRNTQYKICPFWLQFTPDLTNPPYSPCWNVCMLHNKPSNTIIPEKICILYKFGLKLLDQLQRY